MWITARKLNWSLHNSVHLWLTYFEGIKKLDKTHKRCPFFTLFRNQGHLDYMQTKYMYKGTITILISFELGDVYMNCLCVLIIPLNVFLKKIIGARRCFWYVSKGDLLYVYLQDTNETLLLFQLICKREPGWHRQERNEFF